MTQATPPYALAERVSPSWCEPGSLEEAVRLAKTVADSSFCPAQFRSKAGDVLIAMQLGAEVGLSPMAAIQNVAVINGRPSLWGDAMLAVCRAHPDFEDILEELSSDGKAAKCTVKRRGQSPTVSTFTMDDAKRARLAGKKGPWQEYPKRMLKLRARGFALRDAFPDALCGMISAEEARDMPAELPLDEDGVPTHEIKPRTRAEKTLDSVKAKQEAKDAPNIKAENDAFRRMQQAAEVNVAGVGQPEWLKAKQAARMTATQAMKAKPAEPQNQVVDEGTAPDVEEEAYGETVSRSMMDSEKAASTKAEAAARTAGEKQERNEVLAEVVKICTANGTEQKDMLEVVRSILQRNVTSAEAMTLEDCIEVRRVLLEEAAYVQEGADE